MKTILGYVLSFLATLAVMFVLSDVLRGVGVEGIFNTLCCMVLGFPFALMFADYFIG